MSIYHHHSLALTDAEEIEYKKTGLGVKKIFMAMVKALNTSSPTVESISNQQEAVQIEEE